MLSADSSLLNPGLCANTDGSFETGNSPCSETAGNVCTGCYLVQVRYIQASYEDFQVALTDALGISTAVKVASQLIGRSTRRTADPPISRKHGDHRGKRRAASLHLSPVKGLMWG